MTHQVTTLHWCLQFWPVRRLYHHKGRRVYSWSCCAKQKKNLIFNTSWNTYLRIKSAFSWLSIAVNNQRFLIVVKIIHRSCHCLNSTCVISIFNSRKLYFAVADLNAAVPLPQKQPSSVKIHQARLPFCPLHISQPPSARKHRPVCHQPFIFFNQNHHKNKTSLLHVIRMSPFS